MLRTDMNELRRNILEVPNIIRLRLGMTLKCWRIVAFTARLAGREKGGRSERPGQHANVVANCLA
jgi:hypothetical protein